LLTFAYNSDQNLKCFFAYKCYQINRGSMDEVMSLSSTLL
jgi:hypothetical protein